MPSVAHISPSDLISSIKQLVGGMRFLAGNPERVNMFWIFLVIAISLLASIVWLARLMNLTVNLNERYWNAPEGTLKFRRVQ